MSLSVFGAIEYTHHPEDGSDWNHLMDIWGYVNNYPPGLECLWGLDVGPGFEPHTPYRGLPDDIASRTLKDEWNSEALDGSHATLSEIRNVKWDETASEREYSYWRMDPDTDTGIELKPYEIDELPLSDEQWVQIEVDGEAQYQTDGTEYQLERNEMTREYACREGGWWWLIHEPMNRFPAGPDRIRLVVRTTA